MLGPLVEAIAVNFGAWKYANADMAGIPYWLPLAWGLAGVLIKNIADSLKPDKRRQKRA